MHIYYEKVRTLKLFSWQFSITSKKRYTIGRDTPIWRLKLKYYFIRKRFLYQNKKE